VIECNVGKSGGWRIRSGERCFMRTVGESGSLVVVVTMS
jgi:hypothetical protein